MTSQAPVQEAPQPAVGKPRPELALSFWRRGDTGSVVDHWSPTSSDYTTAICEGKLRAVAVLALDVEGADVATKATNLGGIFRSIMFDQMFAIRGRRCSNDLFAIAEFWALIGELAAAYALQNGLGFTAKAVCRHTVNKLADSTVYRLRVRRSRKRNVAAKSAKRGKRARR